MEALKLSLLGLSRSVSANHRSISSYLGIAAAAVTLTAAAASTSANTRQQTPDISPDRKSDRPLSAINAAAQAAILTPETPEEILSDSCLVWKPWKLVPWSKNESSDPSSLQQGHGLHVTEPATKLQFPMFLCHSTTLCQCQSGSDAQSGVDSLQYKELQESQHCQVLTGVGVRDKSIMNLKTINIYAFGLYVCPHRLKDHLAAKYRAVEPEKLILDENFYNDLLSSELDMTVRLVVHYKGLKPGMVRKAFETSLKNRLRKIKGTDVDPGLDTFSSYFSPELKIPRGTVIDFRWQPGGKLITHIAGEMMEPILSRHLCRAFFDMYIGDPPVSLATKRQIGQTFTKIISC